jgi:hypothetical protein
MELSNCDRRGALSLLAKAAVGATAIGWPELSWAKPTMSMPWLASPEQLAAEQMILEIERDPQVKAIQAKLKTDLAGSARAQHIPAAAATLDNAIAQWTRSLIMNEVAMRPWDPVILWSTDDTPRTWLGHALGGVGTSGDNPDAVYRTAIIEGGGRYELLGQFHPDSRPTQLLIEADVGDMTDPAKIFGDMSKHLDIQSAALITDRTLVVSPDGSFRISIGGEADGPNHLPLPPSGIVTLGARDILADWKLRPCQMRLRRLDTVVQKPFGLAEVRALVLRDLEGYITFWANFPNIWMGALKPNTHAEPQARPGGWGFVAGLNFHLAPDEALIVTMSPGEAKYTGFQINDPWMIAPDARTGQVCLNNTQSTPNPDGTFTYVIAKTDPGAANWLDTAGMDDGLAIMRWQQVPASMTNANLIRDFRVMKLAEVASLPDLPRVTPGERRIRIAERAPAYNTRAL